MRTIQEFLDDPCASYWLKTSLRTALERDPVDAAGDAELLAVLLGHRAGVATLSLSVWMMDECDYVAAPTREAAVVWYTAQVGDPVAGVRDVEEVLLSTEMAGPNDSRVTLAAKITSLKLAGATFPAIVARHDI